MTLCPIALAVGCRKCPVFKVCPVKGVIGDYKGTGTAAAADNDQAHDRGEEAPSLAAITRA